MIQPTTHRHFESGIVFHKPRAKPMACQVFVKNNH